MTAEGFRRGRVETPRHHSAWIEAGPAGGPLMVFVHGWPELGRVWAPQLAYFADRGWRCVAPDMRGYGESGRPDRVSDYALRELVADMVELHDALGAAPAVWVGHDWGAAVVWALAAHYAGRCRGIANLCVPYFARGFALANLIPLVDRGLYPAERFPAGQWDYWLYYQAKFGEAHRTFERDPRATLAAIYRSGLALGAGSGRAFTASIRERGGWFDGGRRAPALAPDGAVLPAVELEALARAFEKTGFAAANAWYVNDADNLAYAAEAPSFGRITLPALFLHAAHDRVCDTTRGRLAEPMRDDCADLDEVVIDAGHWLMMEKAPAVNAALARWLKRAARG